MDDKTFIAKYVADESTRIKDRLKEAVESDVVPTEAEKDELIGDIEQTLDRLRRALEQMQAAIGLEDEDMEDSENLQENA